MAPKPTRDLVIDDSPAATDLELISPGVKQGMRDEKERQAAERRRWLQTGKSKEE